MKPLLTAVLILAGLTGTACAPVGGYYGHTGYGSYGTYSRPYGYDYGNGHPSWSYGSDDYYRHQLMRQDRYYRDRMDEFERRRWQERQALNERMRREREAMEHDWRRGGIHGRQRDAMEDQMHRRYADESERLHRHQADEERMLNEERDRAEQRWRPHRDRPDRGSAAPGRPDFTARPPSLGPSSGDMRPNRETPPSHRRDRPQGGRSPWQGPAAQTSPRDSGRDSPGTEHRRMPGENRGRP